MKYIFRLSDWYNKPNKITLAIFVCFWAVSIAGFVMVMDYFREPYYIGYVVIFAACAEIIRLIKNYRKYHTT